MAAIGPNPPEKVTGRARQLCLGTSDVDFFGDLKRVVDLNAELAYCAFDPMAGWPQDRLCPASDYVPLRSVELISWELLLSALNIAIPLAGHF
jgi:hypothetical protein